MRSRAKILLPLLVTCVAMVVTVGVVAVRPSIEATPTPPRLPSVTVVTATPRTVQLTVEAQGSVVPRTESDLVAEVPGRITWVSPSLASGGFLQRDEVLVRIDSGDYEVAVERASAALDRASNELELAESKLRRRETLAEQGVSSAAALDDARSRAGVAAATVRDARAGLNQAQRDLARTQVVSPFAGRVRSKHVDIGQFVSRGAPVARVYAVDYAEVRLPIPDTEAAFVDLPVDYRGERSDQTGPAVRLRARYAGREYVWHGQIVRTEGELDAQTRMIHAVARVEDPYGRSDDPERPPFSVGLFVDAEIDGRVVEQVVSLPREALRRDGRVLVVDAEDRLSLRHVTVLKHDRNEVLIASGLDAGDRVCTPPPSLAVEGMHVRPILLPAAPEAKATGERFVNRMIAWFANNHVAANLLMALTIVGGLLALPTIKQEIFPEIDLPIISVSVEYPGASPREVEEAICVRIEEELQGLQGIRKLRSSAAEGAGQVSVELLADEDVGKRLDEVRSRVDAIDTFPAAARRPTVKQLDVRFQVLDVAVSGDVDEWTLKRLGEQARDEIAALPGVTDVELIAAREYEIAIEVSEDALRRYGLTFAEVSRAVQRSSLDMPGGSLKTRGGEILLRTTGQAYRGSDFESLPLVTRADGSRLRLGDVAEVIDGFEEGDQVSRFDGQPAVLVKVFRVGQQSALGISAEVRAYLDEARAKLPEGVSFTLAQDDSRLLRDRLSTLTRNARSGFALVLLVLALFLRLRLAFWVSLGVPLSFLGALWMLPILGVSINLISLMAFIVVLGIVVDDAIVVGEQAHTEQQSSKNALGGAISGAQRVATPVIFGVLTTIAAFAPMLWVPGPMGRIARVVPLVVCACLVFSLLESLLVLPAHLGHGHSVERAPSNRLSLGWRRLQSRIADALDRFIAERYRPTVRHAIEWRYLTTAIGTAALMITIGTLAGGWMRFVFQPEVEGEVIVAYVGMPRGTPVESTAAAVAQLTSAANAVEAQIASESERGELVINHVLASVGRQPYRKKQATGPSAFARAQTSGDHLGEVQIEVVPAEARSLSVEEITRRWRAETGPIIGVEELSFTSSIMSAGTPLEIEMAGYDLERLGAAAAVVRKEIASYPGVQDVTDSFRGGPRELEIELAPGAESLGITLEALANQVRQAFYGHEAQRIQRGRDDVRVMVRYPAQGRRSLEDLENMRIRSASGAAVPFSAVARATLGEGYATIERVDRKRVVTVRASVDTTATTANEILAEVKRSSMPAIEAQFADIHFAYEGEQREQREVLSSLAHGWLIALVVIYALLAIPLRSYLQPVIIMSAIPFGLAGAVWGHVMMGHDFSMFSILGLVALSGVVVNDSLILVDCVNQKRREGLPTGEALVEAGTARFRAIMLTSLTTFAGLTPLLLETSVQARMMIPMAISLGFGVIFATVISLLLVPAFYSICEDVISLFSRRGSAAASLSGSERNAAIPSAAMR